VGKGALAPCPPQSFFTMQEGTHASLLPILRASAASSLRGALATKQSILSPRGGTDCFIYARNDGIYDDAIFFGCSAVAIANPS
jgi:hypothetical protein